MIRHSVCVVGVLAVLLSLACSSSERQEADDAALTPVATASQGREYSSATTIPADASQVDAETPTSPPSTSASPGPTEQIQGTPMAAASAEAAPSATAALTLTGENGTPSGTPSQGPVIWRRAQSSAGPTGESVVVKFVDGMTVRLTEAGLVSLGPQDVEAVRAVFARNPILEVAPVFTQPVAELEQERHRLGEATGRSLPDLTLFFQLTLEADADAASLVADLVGLNVVETAYVVPPPEPPPAP